MRNSPRSSKRCRVDNDAFLGLERDLRALVEEVRAGGRTRREFVRRLVALGMGAPVANMLLLHEGIPQTPVPISYQLAQPGGGGVLRLLWWQGPVQLNPHFAGGSKELAASRIFYEPLAGWDNEGNLVPILAAEIPTPRNGGVAADGRSVTWTLKPGVTWHDGQPFTADDVAFTRDYAGDASTMATSVGRYRDIRVERLGTHALRVTYPKPTAFWAEAFVGAGGMILPRHHFGSYMGSKSRENPANISPIGTGPYKFRDFKPGDLLRAVANRTYHVLGQPYFDELELKGGGDALTAARAVLQTGEFDYAWNLAVEDEILKRIEESGRGRIGINFGGDVEFVSLNASDPWGEIDGERAHMTSRHPAFSDKAVRNAMATLVDRKGIVDFIYGRGAVATANILNNPPKMRSPNMAFEFDPPQADRILEAAGWMRGPDGIRAKGGRRLSFVFQASANQPRQKAQAVIKAACAKAGIDLELKAVAGSVFFGSDPANPDTVEKFWADMEMYATTMGQPDPQAFLRQFTTGQIAQKSNRWSGTNAIRWSNAEYDATYRMLGSEFDPIRRVALCIRLNDLVVGDGYVIPLFSRPSICGIANTLKPVLSAWDSDTWMLGGWTRQP